MAPLAASKRQWLPLPRWRCCLACQPGRPWRRKASAPAPWGDLFRDGIAEHEPRGDGAPRGGAAAEAAPGRGPVSRARQAGPGAAGAGPNGKPDQQAAPAPPPTPQPSACRLALTDDDRHRAQHSRHPWRRRLRRRGSGAAGGDRAAGQAAGFGEAGGDPALHHGVGAGRLDPQRHRAAGGSASAAPSPISTISTRSNAAAATASSAPSSPSTAAPMRSTFAPSSSPTASRSR